MSNKTTPTDTNHVDSVPSKKEANYLSVEEQVLVAEIFGSLGTGIFSAVVWALGYEPMVILFMVSVAIMFLFEVRRELEVIKHQTR